MLKSKKLLASFLCILVTTAIVFSGCGTKGGEKTDPTSEANKTVSDSTGKGSLKGTVTYLTLNQEDRNYVTKLIPDFNKKFPDIKIEVVTAPYDQFDQKLQTMMAGNTPPDVTSHFGQSGFIDYYNKNMLLDLTPMLQADGYDPVAVGIPEEIANIYKIDGKTYGLPLNTYVSVMAYNKDLFDAAKVPYPPADYEDKSWTWDKMIEDAKKLTKNSSNMSEATYGIEWFWAEPDMRPLYFGAKIYSDDTWTNGGNPSEVYFNTPEVINAYQKLSDLIFKDKISPTDSIVQGLGGQSGESFTSGKIAMKPAGSWLLAGTNELPFKVGVAAIPIGGNDRIRDTLYVDPLVILKDSKHPQAALEWIKFNLEPEIQEKMIDLSGGNPPANMKAFDKYCTFFPNIDAADLKKVYEGGIKYGTESYNHLINNYSQIWTIVKNETDPCLLTGKSTAAEIAPIVQEKVEKLLKELKSKE